MINAKRNLKVVSVIGLAALSACSDGPPEAKFCSHDVWLSGISKQRHVRVEGQRQRIYTSALYSLDRSKETYQPELAGEIQGVRYDALGFNVLDGYLYATDHSTKGTQLLRIDRTGSLEKLGGVKGLRTIETDKFPAGDVDMNGHYWLLQEIASGARLLMKIDLKERALLSEVEIPYTAGDIAVHPQTGELWGYDHKKSTLWRYNEQVGLREASTGNLALGEVAGMFFDADANLYGYEVAKGKQRLVHFDIERGKAKVETTVGYGPIRGNADAASCSYAPRLTQRVSETEVSPGQVVTHSYRISNPHPSQALEGIGLLETLDNGRMYVGETLKIEPYVESNVGAYAGMSSFSLTNIEIPPATSVTISVDVQIPRDLSIIGKDLSAQANLVSVPKHRGENLVAADNPATVAVGDEHSMRVNRPDNVVQISGRVFYDDGKGDGVPNDGLLNGKEAGIPRTAIVARCDDTRCAKAVSDAKGYFSLWVEKERFKRGTRMSLRHVNQREHYSTGAEVGETNGKYDLRNDTLEFTVRKTEDLSGIRFGDIQQNILSKAQGQKVACGHSALYWYDYKARSKGEVDFKVMPRQQRPEWKTKLIQDVDCDTRLDEHDPEMPARVAMDRDDDTEEPARLCMLLKVDAPNCGPDGEQLDVQLVARFDYANAKLRRRQGSLVRTMIDSQPSRSNKLAVKRTVWNLSKKTQDVRQVSPCDVLEYTLHMENRDVQSIRDVVISDSTPAKTFLFSSPQCPEGMGYEQCSPEVVRGSVGQPAEMEWAFSVELHPGEAKTVSYKVQVDSSRECHVAGL